ncbi:MAG: MFS transporter [Tessaracoccus sp.]
MPTNQPSSHRRATSTWAALGTALVFLVALNLRPGLTTVGPLLPQIGQDEGLSEAAQGLLGSLPLLAFAAMSPLVHHLSKRFGMERAILLALVVLAAGTVVRSYTGHAGLWVGTIIIGAAITIGNVLVSALVKRDYSSGISRATGIYSACITIGAAVASAAAVPNAEAVGWRGALAFWAIPALVMAVVWFPRTLAAPTATGSLTDQHALAPVTSVWRQPTAWLVTAFMGLQSTVFYILVTWLPTIEVTAGVSERQAGWHLFIFQIVGILSALTIPRLMRRPESQVAAAVTASVPTLIGVAGLLVAPHLAVIWAIVAGLGSGASLVVALSLISLRGRTTLETTKLSGMAQSLGYLLAALGPVLTGFLAQTTGSWRAPLVFVCTLAAAQVVAAILAGRPRPHE